MRSKRPFRSLIVCVSCAMVGCILASTAYSRRVDELEIERDIYASRFQNWQTRAIDAEENVGRLQTEVDNLTAELNAQTDLTLTYAGSFSCTAYCAEEYAHICGEGHGITSSGAKVQPGVTVAADTSILPYGTVIYIEGVGLRVVQDTGSAVVGNKAGRGGEHPCGGSKLVWLGFPPGLDRFRRCRAVKKSFQAEMDGTQQAISQIVCWCTTIALHQEFGVGKIRLDRITDRMNELEEQNTSVIMTPDANGRPSKQKADSIRESWLAGYVSSDYRIPMVRLPRGRKEQQYRIAGDRAAKIAWQVYAKAVIDVLHYGPDRLERLRKESHANYEQLNKWGHEDGLDVAMEKLRRCAAEAMQAPEMEVSDIDGSKDAAEVDKAFRKQQLNFIKRVRAQALGRIAATTQPVNVLAEQGVQDKVQQIMQQVSQQSFERRRRR